MTRNAKPHNGARVLKERYLSLRSALSEIAHSAPHIGNWKNHCAGNCPVCRADKALVEDAALGRVADDRPREARDA